MSSSEVTTEPLVQALCSRCISYGYSLLNLRHVLDKALMKTSLRENAKVFGDPCACSFAFSVLCASPIQGPVPGLDCREFHSPNAGQILCPTGLICSVVSWEPLILPRPQLQSCAPSHSLQLVSPTPSMSLCRYGWFLLIDDKWMQDGIDWTYSESDHYCRKFIMKIRKSNLN